MARLALSLLGPLHATLDDHPVTGFAIDLAGSWLTPTPRLAFLSVCTIGVR